MDRARTPVNPRLTRGAVLGAILGLTWAAALRAWMSQLAGDATTSTWTTVLLVLLPGAAVGALLGLAGARRSMGLPHRRALVWAPALFATALLDPAIFRLLITTGEGSGALMVVATALTGGVVLSRGRWTVGRVLCAVVWSMGMLLLFFIGTMPAPLSTPLGAWVCLFGASLMAVLSFGAALPHPHGIRGGDALLPWVGAVTGLAWAAGLRGFMSAVMGDESAVSWIGTFGYVLVPGTAIGALLGWAELERRRGRPRRFLVWSPLIFVSRPRARAGGSRHPVRRWRGRWRDRRSPDLGDRGVCPRGPTCGRAAGWRGGLHRRPRRVGRDGHDRRRTRLRPRHSLWCVDDHPLLRPAGHGRPRHLDSAAWSARDEAAGRVRTGRRDVGEVTIRTSGRRPTRAEPAARRPRACPRR